MRLAFCLDGEGYGVQVGVEVRQREGELACVAHGEGDLERIERQVARVLSVDHDGDAFLKVGERDPVIARLLRAAPGLRPPQFYSPYEAAVWSILSARRPRQQAAGLRLRLGAAHGLGFELAGESLPALPTPERLLALKTFPGIAADRMERLHAVARAALASERDVEHLTALEPESAMAELERRQRRGRAR